MEFEQAYENDPEGRALPALDEYIIESKVERDAMISRILGRILCNDAELSVPALAPMEVNGVFLGDGVFLIMLFSLKSDSIDYVANIDRMYNEASQIISREIAHHSVNYISEVAGLIVDIACYHHHRLSKEGLVPVRNMCADSCEKICSILEAKGIQANAYISSAFEGTNHLCENYYETLNLLRMERTLQLPLHPVTLFKPMTGEERMQSLSYFMNRADEISRIAHGGALEQTERMLGEVFDTAIKGAVSMTTLYLRLESFVYMYFNALEAKRPVLMKENGRFQFLLEMTASNMTAAELRKEFLKNMIETSALYSEQGRHADKVTGAMIREYIDEHITDLSLSTTSIAEHFGITQPKVSSIYLKAAGEHLSDYVQRQRVQAAIKLLRETQLPINEIYERAGYGSKVTMYRAFVKYCGMSPTQFRRPNGPHVEDVE